MASKIASAGLALSYAHRVDGRVRLYLQLPHVGGAAGPGARVRIVQGIRSKVADATWVTTPEGTFLDATMPPGALGNGVWSVQVSPAQGARFEPSDARLLVAGRNPLSLLIGPPPATVLPAPVRTLAKRQQVAKALGGVVDSALRQLPPGPASTTRSALRRAARKVSRLLPG